MLVLKGKADFQARDEKGRTAREYAAARRLKFKCPSPLCNLHALRSYAVTRKHDKIAAFLDNPNAPAPDDDGDDDDDDDDEKPKTRVFKASQQLGVSVETKKQVAPHRGSRPRPSPFSRPTSVGSATTCLAARSGTLLHVAGGGTRGQGGSSRSARGGAQGGTQAGVVRSGGGPRRDTSRALAAGQAGPHWTARAPRRCTVELRLPF